MVARRSSGFTVGSDGKVYQYQPPYLVVVGTITPVGEAPPDAPPPSDPVPSLGFPQTVASAAEVPPGWWIFSPDGGNSPAGLLQSDGTLHAPTSGWIQQLTFG